MKSLRVFSIRFFLTVLSLALITKATTSSTLFNVKNYGAVSDGKTDNTKAFLKAWKDACGLNRPAGVYVPEGIYIIGSAVFEGPCKSSVDFMLKGVLRPPANSAIMPNDQWLTFQYLVNFGLNGFNAGTIDGQGAKVWNSSNCNINADCSPLPASITFNFVKYSRIHDFRSINSKAAHVKLYGCENMNITYIHINAPENSPNTDGIKIGSSRNITIYKAAISTGDDCIAICPGSKNVHISKVICGPGHGISVGSLGKYPNEEDVDGLVVKNCIFIGTSNGLRIKTWGSSMYSKASNILYQNIVMKNVQNPIVIDQQYCPYDSCNKQAQSNVQISNVTYNNVMGTPSTPAAVTFNCSKRRPCQDIVMKNVNLWHKGPDGASKMKCNNVKGACSSKLNPACCF